MGLYEVYFYTIFNPYNLLKENKEAFTKKHLTAYAYDEDEDGPENGDDKDHQRDQWTARFRGADASLNEYELHSFVTRPGHVSVLDLAMASAGGVDNPFDAMLRFFRLVNQRIIWGAPASKTLPQDNTNVDERFGAIIDKDTHNHYS